MRLFRSALANIHDQARRGAQIVPSITGASYGGNIVGPNGMLSNGSGQEGIDFAREVGTRFDISVVFAVLAFAQRNMQSVPLRVYRKTGTQKAEIVENHPVQILLERPNPWYPGSLLQGMQVFGEMAWGNSYCYKHRNPNTDEIIALEFLPQGTCYPYTWPGTGEFVSVYWMSTPNGSFPVEPRNMLHIRYAMNVFWPVYGKSPLEALFPEVAADRLASRHEAAVLDNGAVSSVFISPSTLGTGAEADPLKPVLEYSAETARQMEARLREKLTKDAKGSPFVSTFPIKLDKIAFSPEELNLECVHALAEQRVCACYGFMPGAIGFGTGLREQNNRASLDSALTFSIENGLLPYMRSRAEQMTMDLREMLDDGEFIMYDESQIACIQNMILEQLQAAAGRPLLSLNEGRAKAGYGPVKGGDVYLIPKGFIEMGSEDASPDKPSNEDKEDLDDAD